MSLQDNLTAAQAAVDAANTALAEAQAAFNAAQPHLSVLEEIEAAASKLGDGLSTEIMSLVAKARSLF